MENTLHLCVEEAVWEGDGEALGGQEDSPDVFKHGVRDRAGV